MSDRNKCQFYVNEKIECVYVYNMYSVCVYNMNMLWFYFYIHMRIPSSNTKSSTKSLQNTSMLEYNIDDEIFVISIIIKTTTAACKH